MKFIFTNIKVILIIIITYSNFSISQIGGKTSFNNLNRVYNARSLALGGFYISNKDQDPNIGVNNPALINQTMMNHFSFNMLYQTGDIQNGMIVFNNYASKIKCFQNTSLRYVDYGKNTKTNEFGEIIGSFTPIDFILSSGLSKKLNSNFSIGSQLNFLYSQYENFNSIGVSIDFGGHYIFKDTTQSFAVLIKNAGIQLKTFGDNNKRNLPTEIQMSYSHKLKHAPFRFSYLFHHLNEWDLSYNDPNVKGSIDPLSGDSILPKKASIIQKVALHITPQIELILSNHIHLRFAFDYLRRYQFALTNRPGLSGFSFGLGLYFKRFNLDYGFSSYSVAGNTNGITLTSSLDKWRKKSIH